MTDSFESRHKATKARQAKGELTKEQAGQEWLDLFAQAKTEFNRTYRVDARMRAMELRNRISYESRKHIVGFP
jgi:hypothetical protein